MADTPQTKDQKKEPAIISSQSYNKYDPYSLKAAVDEEVIAVGIIHNLTAF
jgi:hypothetical protein